MHIDIVSDTICPWCYIGKRRLETALAERPDMDVTIEWRPYQLNPDIPQEGMSRQEFIAGKPDGEDETRENDERAYIVGEAEDLPFAFDLIERTPNTVDSHRLIRWSHSVGVQDAVVEKLFERYFMEGGDIGDPEVLLEIADEVGLDYDLVADLLSGEKDIEAVQEENEKFKEMGVTGIPCFIIDHKYVVMGAQEAETFLQMFEQVETNEAEAAEADEKREAANDNEG
ncbi:MAG: DsbA family oxidoreductase [Alphaproteobacteria bacterium]|jgi:predicted DsbA family dithiol-disulfide isomerase|nr:DsbA family oxidoreductase [Alphaproteobacteria bacterium]MBT4019233.1 DsbA family oxidoreductase [Alphaproteobacteria bacterium]MBT4967224.1 DsbA family oxidoreductase [Alphaproteobacteria bacterium]MBT5159961.1 DsbA family oxidoreductase [Alphaproteobacteria bacterium]MBT5917562.1 DsbA family oxidoreductase [Alphaproteobacteria bacterium]